jgi:hypothetical protein
MSVVGMAGAALVGIAFGYGAQRGSFCMNSGFRGVLDGEWTKVKALALAVAVQLVALPFVFAAGMARPAELFLRPAAAVAGGVLFGSCMRWAGGCAAGVWYKLGAGDLGVLLTIVGMALGATASETGPLVAIRVGLQEAVPPIAPWKPAPVLLLVAGVLLATGLARGNDGKAGAWSWRVTGLWIGTVAALAWPISALAGRDFGLAVVPGTTSLLSAASSRLVAPWDAVLVLGFLIGGWVGARRVGAVTLAAPAPAVLLKRLAGGVGLGVGASIASGCTVGQGLTGFALLAPSSFLVTASIFGGSALSTLFARRRDMLSRPPLPQA